MHRLWNETVKANTTERERCQQLGALASTLAPASGGARHGARAQEAHPPRTVAGLDPGDLQRGYHPLHPAGVLGGTQHPKQHDATWQDSMAWHVVMLRLQPASHVSRLGSQERFALLASDPTKEVM